MVNFCPNCGNKIEPGSKFCNSCGKQMIDSEKSPVQKPTTDLKKFSAQKPAENFQNNSPTGFSDEEETEQNEMPKEEFVPDSGIGQMFFTTTGRLNRLRYLKRILVLGIFGGILSTAGIFLDQTLFRQEFGLFYVIAQSFFLWSTYCLDVRRLKDLDKGNFLAIIRASFASMQAICFAFSWQINRLCWNLGFDNFYIDDERMVIGFGGAFFLFGLYLFLTGGTPGANKYGPDPLEKNSSGKRKYDYDDL